MAYFPFFMELSTRRGLVVGGGAVALRKAEKLLSFGAALTVVSPAFLPSFFALEGVEFMQSNFTSQYLENIDFAIAATDDFACNHAVACQCWQRGIPVNSVTDAADCTFLFPALVQRGDLVAGVTTGGKSPAAAAWVREAIEGLLPERLEEILLFLEPLRQEVRTREPDGARRGRLLSQLTAAAMGVGRPLRREEIEAIIAQEGGTL